jgi:hypothetical protein
MFNLRSNLFEGVGEDAAYVAQHINARSAPTSLSAEGTCLTAVAAMDLLLSSGF